MRLLSFAAATIFCGVGCTFYGVEALNTNSLVQPQTANEISSETKANIQNSLQQMPGNAPTPPAGWVRRAPWPRSRA
jgi:hypothetical protein